MAPETGGGMKAIRRFASMGAVMVAALGLAACGSSTPGSGNGAPPSQGVSAAVRGRLDSAYGRLPLTFVPNRGQSDPRVRYEATGSGFEAGLTDTGVLLSLDQSGQRRPLSVSFAGVDGGVQPVGEGQLKGRVNYLVGDRRDWETNLAMFSGASYRRVWPGIDAWFSGSQHRLEYTFTVAPGADPRRIALGYAGQTRLRIAHDGSLLVTVRGDQRLRQLSPRTYQVEGTRRVIVPSHYVLHGDRVGIEVGRYDHHRRLIIDPTIALAYSTYLGGNQGDQGFGIAIDSAGDAYITGNTQSTNFATPGSFQPTLGGTQDAFVAKLSQDGQTLDYVTYLGGSASDFGQGIAVDSAQEPYVVGATFSTDFPTKNALTGQSTFESGESESGYVLKLNSAGNGLVFSTLLGGNNFTQCNGVAVDSQGNAYVTGDTAATDFPLSSGAYRKTQMGAAEDAFATELSGTGGLDFSTLVGGNGGDDGSAIVPDGTGGAWITGGTNSTDLATAGSPQATNPSANEDAFVLHLAPGGTSVIYATYLGGSQSDGGNGIALDPQGNVYVAGVTDSSDFPTTTGAAQTTFGGGDSDAFVTEYTSQGGLVYSTYLGGPVDDEALGIAVDAAGSAYVTGDTKPIPMEDGIRRGMSAAASPHQDEAGGFPVENPIQSTSGGGEDAFVTKLTPDGKALVYSTYLGGSGDDGGTGIAVDLGGNAYITGSTDSTDFPTANPENGTENNGDAFAAKIATGDFALTVTKSGSGAGTVTSVPAGIGCGSTCAANFAAGSQVKLTAAAASGSTFQGWSGGGCSGTAMCTVTMSTAQNVTATFDKVSAALGVPANTGPPVISGKPLPGKTLSCSTGTWTNSPTQFGYQWNRQGSALTGATGSTYVVQIADEASSPADTLTCTVTASNAAGAGTPATSAGVLVASGSTKCPQPTGSLGGQHVGVLSIGETKARARKRLKRFQVTKNRFDNFCLFAGWGIRAAYPSKALVDSVKPPQRHRLSGRIVIALTANPFYAFKGTRPGMKESAVAKRLQLGKPFHIGTNLWYIAPARPSNGVLKVRGGVIQEVGLVNRLLTATRSARKRLLNSFPNG